MKKFSTIANVTVGTEPIIKEDSKQDLGIDSLRYTIDSMIDQYLTIGFYGPYTTEHFQQTSKIEGREVFIEALMSALANKEVQSQIKVLESLKANSNDWKMIDEKIDTLTLLLEKQTPSETAKHKKRVIDLLAKADPEKMAETQASKIASGEKAYYRYLMAKSLSESGSIESIIKTLKKEKKVELTKSQIVKYLGKIEDIFKFKADQLGYKN